MAEIENVKDAKTKVDDSAEKAQHATTDITPADHKAAQAAAQDRTADSDKQVPAARMQPDIPPEIMLNTQASNDKYDSIVGGLVIKKLMEHPDSKSGSTKPDPDAGVGEPPTNLDRELHSLTNQQLAERLQKDQNDPALRKQFEDNYKNDPNIKKMMGDIFDQREKSNMMAELYQKLTGPGSSKENQMLAQQLRTDFQDPQKGPDLLNNFKEQFLDKYSAIFNDKSNPNFSKSLEKTMDSLKADWKKEPDSKASFLKDGIQWPGKGKNCCCASERDKAAGMISWIEKGTRAQNSSCHMNFLEQYFPPKSIEFQKK